MAFSQLRPLSFGEILDGSFTLYRRHFASMFLTALIPQIPMIAWSGLYSATLMSAVGNAGAAPDDPTALFGSLLGVMVLLPLVGVATVIGLGAVAFQVSRAYTGSPVGTGEALRRGWQRGWALIGAGIVWGMMVWFGSILCLVPGILALIATFAWVPAVVLERRGPVEAIQRSIDLAKNTWGEIFLMQLVVWLITFLPGMVVSMFVLLGMGGVAAAGGGTGSIFGVQVIAQVLSGLVRALTIPFSMGCTVLLYYDRRVRTEALDVQMMAESLNADGSPAGGYPAGAYGPAGGYAPAQGYPYASGGSGFNNPGYGQGPAYPGGPGQTGAQGYPAGGPTYGGPSYGGPQHPAGSAYPGAPEYPAGPSQPGTSSGPGTSSESTPPPPRGPGYPETPADPNGG